MAAEPEKLKAVPAVPDAGGEPPANPGPMVLREALLAFQREAIKVSKDSEADTGKYKYKYLSLDKLLEEVLPILSKHDLVWIALPGVGEGLRPILDYQLQFVHTGEAIGGIMPLMVGGNANPQDLGSALTYARRYALLTVLNLAPDEDADGQVQRPQGRSDAGVRRIPKAQAKKLAERAQRAGCLDMLQLAATHTRGGEDVGSCETVDEATSALAQLNALQADKVLVWIAKKEQEALGEGMDGPAPEAG